VIQGVALGGLVLSLRLCLKYLDPYKEQRALARKRAAFLKEHLGRDLQLDEYEQLLAAQVINPRKIEVELGHVSGLDDLIQELEAKVVVPMLRPELYRTTLWKPARGVLLYGPPGTGKTMLAKSLAKHSGCYFLNITASSIMSKWLGDANRLVRAIFSLASKLQPCIIFIDEVDAMLGKRGMSYEHEASLQVKTEFMQLWDGMESAKDQRIVVMGATNRPWCVDEAVLRRFSIQHEVGLPNAAQRVAILHSYLTRHNSELGGKAVDPELLSTSSGSPSKSIETIGARTEGFSGSDLMELCSQAAQSMLSEHWSRHCREMASSSGSPSGTATRSELLDLMKMELRPVTLNDFLHVLSKMQPSTNKAQEYNLRTRGTTGGGSAAGGGDKDGNLILMELLAQLAKASAASNSSAS